VGLENANLGDQISGD